MKGRDSSITIAKGIAIVLMVMAHARCPLFVQYYINMFHMPLFFFFSGYCFKTTYLSQPQTFVLRRIKTVYWPYIKWSLLFLIFHNVFYFLNIYNSDFGYKGVGSILYSWKDFIIHAFNIVVRMYGHEQLLGGYWFMKSLFCGSIIFFFVLYFCKRKKIPNVVGGVLLLLITFLMLFLKRQIPFIGIGAKEFLAAFFIISGYMYKEKDYKFEITKPKLFIPLGMIVVAIGTIYWQSGMLVLTWEKLIPYTVTAFVGIVMIFSISKLMFERTRWLCDIFILLGDKTLTILTWHLLSFKVISLCVIIIYGLPLERLAEFPVIEEYAYFGWWIMYLIVGITIPLLPRLIHFSNRNK